ncbi:hypothetical protein QUC31_006915, partial [Theobroma cacao]
MNRTRILAFKNKPPLSDRDMIHREMGSQLAKKREYISQILLCSTLSVIFEALLVHTCGNLKR